MGWVIGCEGFQMMPPVAALVPNGLCCLMKEPRIGMGEGKS